MYPDEPYPSIDKVATGKTIRNLMKLTGITVKDIQEALKLGSVQSVYHWLNGISLPTVDNFYALSKLFNVPVDKLICGNMSDNMLADIDVKKLKDQALEYSKKRLIDILTESYLEGRK